MTPLERKIAIHKKKFDRQLRHLKIILMEKKRTLPSDEWMRLVYATRKSVMTHPEEYLDSPPPEKEVVIPAVEKVFNGFLEDQKIREAQKPNVN